MTEPQTRLLLIRHGQTEWNVEGRWQGHGNPSLTEEGRAQALRLARSLSGDQERGWTAVYSSDLERARQTAAVVAEELALPLVLDRRLRELDVGHWSGLTRAEISQREPERLRDFESGDPLVRPGDGETRLEIRERSHALVADLARRCAGDRILVVTHLGVIRSLVPGADPDNAGQLEIIAEHCLAQRMNHAGRAEGGAL
ncbi:MAG: histidine phosphatase family protein [Myxococcota bacterium]